MKLPRSVSGDRLTHALQGVGYTVVRQKGSMFGCDILDRLLMQLLSHCTIP